VHYDYCDSHGIIVHSGGDCGSLVMMKVLFLTNDMRVKHFHMASAIRSKYGTDAKIYLMHIWPTHRVVSGRFLVFRNKGPIVRLVKDAKESGIFNSIRRYHPNHFENLEPDIVYVNDMDGIKCCFPPVTKDWLRFKLICDIEDLAAIDTDIHKDDAPLERESKIFSSPYVDGFLFGSVQELVLANETYPILGWLEKGQHLVSSRVQYPLVAESTLIRSYQREPEKHDEFSVVYAGSVWGGGGYRDLFGQFAKFGKLGINLGVYMLNDWSKHNWDKLNEVAKKYPSVKAFRRLKLFEVKQGIQRYHAGLYLTGDFNKVNATYGMKPLEYAYAGVVPVGITDGRDIGPVRNLSNGKPFGNICTLNELSEAGGWIDNNLKNFDWDYHLMDNHLDKFSELVL
jgi:hypothetical protein